MSARGRATRAGLTVRYAVALLCVALAIDMRAARADETLAIEHVRFADYGVQDGLSQVTVRAISQDSRGFLWFGTQDGLNRFDGHEFHVFRNDSADSATVPDNHILSLAAGDDGSMWVGTNAGGLARYDATREAFTTWRHRDGDDASLGADNVYALWQSPAGRLWVASGSGRLQWIGTDERFVDAPAARAMALGRIRCLHGRPDGSFILCSRGGVWSLSANGEAQLEYRDDAGARITDAEDVTVRGNEVVVARSGTSVARLRSDGAWIGAWRATDGLPGDTFNATLTDRRGRVWIAGQQGLARVGADGTLRSWHMGAAQGRGDDRVQSLFEDRDGLLWIGTWLDGIRLFNPRTEAFGELHFGALHPDRRVPDAITAVWVDRDQSLWLGGFEGGGIVHYDRERGVLEHVHAEPARVGGFPDALVNTIVRDRPGNLWVATNAGLLRRRAGSVLFERFSRQVDDPASLPSDSVQQLALARDGTLWIGTAGGGLVSLCEGCDRFRRYPLTENAGADTRAVNALIEDAHGRIWVGLRPGGVAIVDPLTGRVTHARAQPGQRGALSHDVVSAFARAPDGAMWVGTQGGGVNRAVPTDDGGLRFETIGTSDGLAADAIGGIVVGDDGRVWLSTTVGISVFDPATRRIENFGGRDGAQFSGYFIGATSSWNDGTIVFGGIGGATLFDPRAVESRAPLHAVQITDFSTQHGRQDRRNARALDVLSVRESGAYASLARGVDDFSVGYSALSFADPNTIRYAYRLDGIDGDWNETDARRRFASYGNLDPGEYVMRVRARRPGEPWGEDTRLTVAITPSPWLSTLAVTMYAIAGFALFALAAWQARERLREQRRARRSLAASEERLKLALWGTGDELWDLDLVTMELRRENALDHLAGANEPYVRDARGMRRFIHPDDVAGFEAALRRHLRGDSSAFDADYRLQHRDGEWRWVRTRGKVVRRDEESQPLRLAGTTSDINEMKTHELALETLNHELEDRVTERTAALRHANENLRQTIDELRRTQHQLVESEKMAALGGLVAGIAHEINTPLGIGVTAASHLEAQARRIGKLLDDASLHGADIRDFHHVALESSRLILANLQRADKLVKSFKQVAVDQSSEQRRRINLRAYLDEVLTSLLPALKKTTHRVHIECPDDLVLDTYPGAIYQIIVNLVMNSLTHAFDIGTEGHIGITASRTGDFVLIDHHDDGRGMDDATRRRLFEPFFTTRRGQGGSGLGMHIAWNLATQVLRGTIVCDSAPGRGTRFLLRFPG
jgi:ligand-binding sensor domain-containing protein/signal transduction histidine kinase